MMWLGWTIGVLLIVFLGPQVWGARAVALSREYEGTSVLQDQRDPRVR
ncbi:MAG: hypothetical protein RL091_3396 [Verrucomicrobiota bacterium]|jgi:hypothetical protein